MHGALFAFYCAIEIVVVIGGIVSAFLAARYHLEAQKHLSTAAAKDEAIKALSDSTKAFKHLYEAEHADFVNYRDKTHAKNETDNAQIIALSNEVGQLRARTDLSPVLEFQKKQAEVNERLIAALDKIVKLLEKLRGRRNRKKKSRKLTPRSSSK